MRKSGSPEWWATLRGLAVTRVLEGRGVQEVADFLGVHVSTVCHWLDRFARGGWEALAPAPVSGRPAKLTARQVARLVIWVRDRQPQDFGLAPGPWTAPRVAALVAQHWGVEFHPRYLNDFLRRQAVTPQIPDRVSRERNEAAVAQWVAETWPALKRGRSKPAPPSCLPTKPGS